MTTEEPRTFTDYPPTLPPPPHHQAHLLGKSRAEEEHSLLAGPGSLLLYRNLSAGVAMLNCEAN